MAVLITAEVPGQTEEKYDRMLAVLKPLLHEAKGFIAHGAGPTHEGWRSFEVWETQEDATEFFAKYIHPNLPEGIKPQRTLLELHSLVKAK
jgi:heme-degrading monooxygenase HmoA